MQTSYQRLAPCTKARISLDRRLHADHHRAADDAVADVELLDLRDRRDRRDVAIGEPVARMDRQAHVGGVARGAAQLRERRIALSPGVGVSAGVQLDRRHAEVLGRVERGEIGIDEEADPDPGLVQPPDGLAHARVRPREIEPALGGHFLPPLRHERRLVRPKPAGERDDLVARRQLQVEHRDRRREPLDVLILDMPAVFAQVHGDAVGAAGDRSARRPRSGSGSSVRRA